MKLTEKAIAYFIENNEADCIEKIKDFENFHQKYFIAKHKPQPEKPESLLGQNGLHFIQMCLYRSYLLFDGYIDSINNNNELSGAVCIRAHFETTAATAYFSKKLRSYYDGKIDFEELDAFLERLLLGIKTKGELERAPDPVNVLTMIKSVDDQINEINNTGISGFMNTYDLLSEFCHPNSFGLQIAGDINKVGVVRYKPFEKPFNINLYFTKNFLMSSSAFMLFYLRVRNLLEAKEDLPIIIS
ncbi:hypothetical protein J2TS6_48160 [Paenibacillus albilobatus]|uniref:Uncharacterized protein n=1 Tax=Paenibacillus albilobatus TaxID=2716884 RepID=A0A919XMT2_9BACL|nr:hypothetical protein [Paenibacillus albilobatus]GIO33675.1 hypothetical protein J2TS6_48160 [Paenibacillus albilobatus]